MLVVDYRRKSMGGSDKKRTVPGVRVKPHIPEPSPLQTSYIKN